MNLHMSVTGTTTVLTNLKKLTGELMSANVNSLKTAAFDMVGQTKGQITQNKSVISGTLRRSVNAQQQSELEWHVGSLSTAGINIVYAPYVEARKPFLQPSLDVIAARFPQIVTSGIDRVI